MLSPTHSESRFMASFEKYAGCGNDFILFDNRQGTFPLDHPGIIQSLCSRKQGIGADGVLLLENSSHADARMRIFNSDSSEAEMCGNGLRCFAKWLQTLGYDSPTLSIEVMGRFLITRQEGDGISIEMGPPQHIEWNIPVSYNARLLTVHHMNTGVPHTILFAKELDTIDLADLGPYLRNHPLWMPKGTNVTVVQQLGKKKFKIRTFERGVEGETLACGTGATAAALASARLCDAISPIVIETLSKEELIIHFAFENGNFSEVTLTGAAQRIFKGEIVLQEAIKV